jgi:SAM-dependent methyltransferase
MTTLSDGVRDLLRCPRCGSTLRFAEESVYCQAESCGKVYPAVRGIPILVAAEKSVFNPEELVESEPFFRAGSRLGVLIDKIVPALGHNLRAKSNLHTLRCLAQEGTAIPRILVLGGSILGDGMAELLAPDIELVETDISIGPRTQIVFDAHTIPFPDASFDAVVLQAVLEHVLDPFLVVAETFRVIKPGGIVYAEVPFMQQVHGGAYDFTRFTHLGCLRLFRHFNELASGATAGPGTSLAWAYDYFLSSFVTSPKIRILVHLICRMAAAPLKYFDSYLLRNPGGLDAASGIYFLGRRAETPLEDRELVKRYRGSNPSPRERGRVREP